MPKAVRVNKSRRKHRKAEFENYYNKEKEIGKCSVAATLK